MFDGDRTYSTAFPPEIRFSQQRSKITKKKVSKFSLLLRFYLFFYLGY